MNFNKDELVAILDAIGGDGHGIYPLNAFAEQVKIDASRLAPFCENYKSNFANPKQTITKASGAVVASMTGIYGLDMLRKLYATAKLPNSHDMPTGRGFLARWYTAKLREFAETM